MYYAWCPQQNMPFFANYISLTSIICLHLEQVFHERKYLTLCWRKMSTKIHFIKQNTVQSWHSKVSNTRQSSIFGWLHVFVIGTFITQKNQNKRMKDNTFIWNKWVHMLVNITSIHKILVTTPINVKLIHIYIYMHATL